MSFTLAEYSASSSEKDPKKLIEDYRGAVQLSLLGEGQFDDEVMADVDNQLLQHAKDSGIEMEGFGLKDDDDTQYVARHALDTGDAEAGQAANRLRALRDPSIRDSYADRPDEYAAKLEEAQAGYEAAAPLEKREAARRNALNLGDIPFAVFQDKEGNKRLELGAGILGIAGDDKALAEVFKDRPDLDRSLIPEIRRKLQTPEGFTAPLAKIERQQDAFAGIEAMVKANPKQFYQIDSLREAISDGAMDNLDPYLDQLNDAMSGTPLAEQFGEEERKAFLKDYITQQSQARLDPDAPEKGLHTLSTGQVHIPTSLMMNKATFDKVLPKLPEGQQAMAADHREKVVAAYAKDAFKTIIARRGDEFTDHYADQKAAGKTDTQILDEWTADPENQSTAYEYVSGYAASPINATLGTAAALTAKVTGNKTAMGIALSFYKADQERKDFANLLGKDMGVGYDIGTMIAPVLVDIRLTGGVATALRATAGVAARAAIKPVVKGFLGATVRAETRGLVGAFVEGSVKREIAREGLSALPGAATSLKPTQVLNAIGRDIEAGLVRAEYSTAMFATGYTRSAGAAYVQTYSTLEGLKNPDGSRKFNDEQVRDMAVTHATMVGTMTGLTTLGFNAIGLAGTEKIFDGGLTRKQLGGVFSRLKKDWGNMAPSVKEGLDMTSADTMLATMMTKSIKPLWKIGVEGVKGEVPEEATQNFLEDILTSYNTGEKFDIDKSIRGALYAGMLGGVMGGGATVTADIVSSPKVDAAREAAVRRNALLTTAAKLDANPNTQKTAAALREFALNGIPQTPEAPAATGGPDAAQEDLPEGVPAEGAESAPGGQGVADPSTVTTNERITPIDSQGEPAAVPSMPDGDPVPNVDPAMGADDAGSDAPTPPSPEQVSAYRDARRQEIVAEWGSKRTRSGLKPGTPAEVREELEQVEQEVLSEDTEVEFNGETLRVIGYQDDGRMTVAQQNGAYKNLPAGAKVAKLAPVENPYATLVADVEPGFEFLDRLNLQKAPESAEEIPTGDLPRGTRYFRSDTKGTGAATSLGYAITPEGLLYEDSGRSMTHGGASPYRLQGKIGTGSEGGIETPAPEQSSAPTTPQGPVVSNNAPTAPAAENPTPSPGPLMTYSEWMDASGEKAAPLKLSGGKGGAGVDVDAAQNRNAKKNGKIREHNEAAYAEYVAEWEATGGDLSKLEGESNYGEDRFRDAVAWTQRSRGDAAASELLARSGKYQKGSDGKWSRKETPVASNNAPNETTNNQTNTGTSAKNAVPNQESPAANASVPDRRGGSGLPVQTGSAEAGSQDAEEQTLDNNENATQRNQTKSQTRNGGVPLGAVAEVPNMERPNASQRNTGTGTAASEDRDGEIRRGAAEANASDVQALKEDDIITFTSPSQGISQPTQGKLVMGRSGKLVAQVERGGKTTNYAKFTLVAEPTQTQINSEAVFAALDLDPPATQEEVTVTEWLTDTKPGHLEIAMIENPQVEADVDKVLEGVPGLLNAKDLPAGLKIELLQGGVSERVGTLVAAEGGAPSSPTTAPNSPVTQELAEHGGVEDIKAFLTSVAKNGKPEHRPLARLLLLFPSPPVAVVKFANNRLSDAYLHEGYSRERAADAVAKLRKQKVKNRAPAGYFSPRTGQIILNSENTGPSGAVGTLLHELIHAATEASILNPTPEQAKVLKRIDGYRKTLKARAEKAGLPHLAYGLGSNSEFFAHFMESARFQREIDSLTRKGDKSFVQLILEAIRDLINGKATKDADMVSVDIIRAMIEFTQSAADPRDISRMGQLLLMPAGEVRDSVRFHELTRDLGESPTQADIDAFKTEQPGAYAELKAMRERVLREAGYDVGPVYHGSPELRNIQEFRLPEWLPRSARGDIPRNRGAFFFSKDPAYSEEYTTIDTPAGSRKPETAAVGEFSLSANNTFEPLENEDHVALAREWFESNRDYAGQEIAEYYDTDTWGPISDKRLDRIMDDLVYGGWAIYELFPKFQDFVKGQFDSYAMQEGLSGQYDTVAVFNPNQIKSSEPLSLSPEGKLIPPSQWGNAASPSILFQMAADERSEQPAASASASASARHAALEAKHNAGTITPEETAEAERIVEERARAAGFNDPAVYHGGSFNAAVDPVFRIPEGPKKKNKWQLAFGAHFADNPAEAAAYLKPKGVLTKAFLKGPILDARRGGNIAVSQELIAKFPEVVQKRIEAQRKMNKQFGAEGDAVTGEVPVFMGQLTAIFDDVPPATASKVLRDAGFSGFAYTAKAILGPNSGYRPFDAYIIVDNPSNIKSADPFTGVPLDQRFDDGNPSILFQPSELLAASHDAGIAALSKPTEAETAVLREFHELTTTGNVSARQRAQYRVDATALDRLVTYLRAAVADLTASLKRQFNMTSAVHLDRLGRELAAAEDGYRVRSGVKAFDPNDAPLMQMSEGTLSADEARQLLKPSEKENGVDPRTYKIMDGRRYIRERIALSRIRANEEGERYDSTVRDGVYQDYAARGGEFPPVILAGKDENNLSVSDGGHRVSAARLRGDAHIDSLRLAPKDAPLFQLSSDSPDSESTETNFTEVHIGNKLHESTEEDLGKKNWFVRMFAQRNDLLRAQSAIKVDHDAMVNATAYQVGVKTGIYNRAIKKESPNMDDVRKMAGSTAPMLTPEEEVRLDTEYQARLDAAHAGTDLGEIEAKATRDKAIRDAQSAHDAAMLSADPGERAEAVANYGQAVKDAEAEYRRASQAAKEAAEIEDPGVTAAKDKAETLRENARKQRDLAQEQVKQDYDDEVQSPDEATRVAARGKYEARLKQIKSGHDRTIAEITKERDKAISLRSPEAREAQAVDEANEWLRNAKEQSMLDQADKLRTEQDAAAERLARTSPQTHAAVLSLRKTLDEFQAKLAKVNKSSKPGLSLMIDRSNGLYLVRSYEFYRDPQRREKIMNDPLYADLKERLVDLFGKEFARDALAVLKADPANANRPDADLEALARSNVRDLSLAKFEDYLLSRDGPAKMGNYAEGVRMEVERFMKKNNQDPLIAEMLGEIEDPLFNLSNTIESVSHLLFMHRQNTSLANDGKAAGYLVTEAQMKADPTKYRGWVSLVSNNPDAPAFSPLGGLYATAEHKKAFDAAFGTGHKQAINTANEALSVGKKLIMGAAGKSMATMILGNPASYVRNLFGNPFVAASQGVNPFSKKGLKSAMATLDMVRGQGKGDQAFIEKMIAYRILGDGAKIEFMREFLAKYKESPTGAAAWVAERGEKLSPDAMEKLRKGKGAWDKLTDILGRSSEFTETFLGPLVFLNELEVHLNAGFSQIDAEQEAARIAKKVLPGKSERSQAVTEFGKSGVATLMAPFLGFKSEMIRSVIGTWQVAIEHTLSDNPVLAAHGRRRIAASFAIQGGIVTLLPILLRSLAGVDDEEDQLFRASLPSYAKNSNFWYFRGDDGSISTWDMTFAIPYSITHDWTTQTFLAIHAAATTNPERLNDVPLIFGRLFGEELVGEQIVAGKVLDVMRNKDDTSGNEIWRRDEALVSKMYKQAEHVIGGAYIPAGVKKVDQLIKSANRPDKEDEPFWYTPLGITTATVAPFKPRSHETEKFVTRALREVTTDSRQQWTITSKLTSPQAMAPGEATRIIKERNDAHLKNSTRAYRFMQAAKGFNMTPREIMMAAKEADMSQERAQLALQGYANSKPLPAETLRKIKEIDPKRYAEVVRAMRQQPSRVNLRDR